MAPACLALPADTRVSPGERLDKSRNTKVGPLPPVYEGDPPPRGLVGLFVAPGDQREPREQESHDPAAQGGFQEVGSWCEVNTSALSNGWLGSEDQG